jgi:hypothetical protein
MDLSSSSSPPSTSTNTTNSSSFITIDLQSLIQLGRIEKGSEINEQNQIILRLFSSKIFGVSGTALYCRKGVINLEFLVIFTEKEIINVCDKQFNEIKFGGLAVVNRYLKQKCNFNNDNSSSGNSNPIISISTVLHHLTVIGQDINQSCQICFKKFPMQVYKPSICTDLVCFNLLNIDFDFEQQQYGLETMYKCQFFGSAILELLTTTQQDIGKELEFYGLHDLLTILNKTPQQLFKLLGDVTKGMKSPFTDLLPSTNKPNNKPKFEEIPRMMKWVLTNQMSTLVDIGPVKIPQLDCWEKMLVFPNDVEKELQFQDLKSNSGGKTYYVFSGTSVSRAHAILRYGLRSLSGTSKMLHGASYGNGIYTSTCSSTSGGYAQSAYNRFGFTGSTTSSSTDVSSTIGQGVLMVCEIFSDREPTNIFVVQDYQIRVRMFILDQLKKPVNNSVVELKDLDLMQVLKDAEKQW